MIQVKKEGRLLSKSKLKFENEAVLNPSAIREGDSVHLFYRAVRKGNYSSIGYCRLSGPLIIGERWTKPVMTPDYEYESHGIEDPRIVKIDDLYFLTYTAYDGTNALGALAISKDLKHFKKHGIIVPQITYSEFLVLIKSAGSLHENYFMNHEFSHPNKFHQDIKSENKIVLWDKDVIFFPRRINKKLVFLHRMRPGIQIVSVTSLLELSRDFWKNYFLNLQEHIVMDPVFAHESSYIGGGCPPIETEQGWLLIYHGMEITDKGEVYSACAALLDIDNPSKELARLPYALFSPEYNWELIGEVNNVVFPTGTALFGDTLYIYYGAADSHIACASLSLSALLSELITYKNKNEKYSVNTGI